MSHRFIYLALALMLSVSTTSLIEAQTGPLSDIQALLDSGRAEEALEALDRRLKKKPSDASALFLRSTARIMTGDLDGGRADLEQSLAIEPGRREAWINRAALDLAEASFDGALEGFLEAERLDPTAQDNSLNIGAALLFLGDRDAASQRFRRYLESQGNDPNAFYLVAANYAMAERGDLAVPLLKRAIALEEKTRLRARRDSNFAALVDDPAFQELLTTDVFEPAADSHSATAVFPLPFAAREDRVLDATITALQLAGDPMPWGVEVTPEWALVWSDLRIKIAADTNEQTRVTLSAPRDAFTDDEWSARSEALFRQIKLQLHSRRPSSASPS